MTSPDNISQVFEELCNRYSHISTSTINSLLKGKLRIKTVQAEFKDDKESTPDIEEAKTAFRKHTCAIFTAFRGGFTLEENVARNQMLKADMEAVGLKYRPVTGCYREADWEYPSIEYCYFVYNKDTDNNFEFFSKVFTLSNKYDQDSFLYKRSGINRTAFLVATTEAGKRDIKGNISLAGQLFEHVPDVDAWTDCSDGRIAFQLKGMLMVNTPLKALKIGQGNLFDTDSYGADGIVIIREEDQTDMEYSANNYKGDVPIAQHIFSKKNPNKEYLHKVIFQCLKQIRDNKCKHIAFHCSVSLYNSAVEGASFTLDTLKLWLNRFGKKICQITVVDIYGDYSRVLYNKTNKNL